MSNVFQIQMPVVIIVTVRRGRWCAWTHSLHSMSNKPEKREIRRRKKNFLPRYRNSQCTLCKCLASNLLLLIFGTLYLWASRMLHLPSVSHIGSYIWSLEMTSCLDPVYFFDSWFFCSSLSSFIYLHLLILLSIE